MKENDDLIGRIIADKYEILSLLGRGGMSVVYKARHTMMNRIVAVKMLRPDLVSVAQLLERFKVESSAASSLRHPNIVTLFDFGLLIDGSPYMIMDYLEGVTLADILKREKKLSIKRTASLFAQACDGLAHAHEKGVVHRDIKPSNLLVQQQTSGDERVTIFDFGIAKVLGEDGSTLNKLTSSGEVFGSPLYMSPEQCAGERVGPATDIYSLACCIYEALAGRTPFHGTSPMETLMKHMNEDPPLLSSVAGDVKIPEALEACIMRALEKDPDDRQPGMLALRDELIVSTNLELAEALPHRTYDRLSVHARLSASMQGLPAVPGDFPGDGASSFGQGGAGSLPGNGGRAQESTGYGMGMGAGPGAVAGTEIVGGGGSGRTVGSSGNSEDGSAGNSTNPSNTGRISVPGVSPTLIESTFPASQNSMERAVFTQDDLPADKVANNLDQAKNSYTGNNGRNSSKSVGAEPGANNKSGDKAGNSGKIKLAISLSLLLAITAGGFAVINQANQNVSIVKTIAGTEGDDGTVKLGADSEGNEVSDGENNNDTDGAASVSSEDSSEDIDVVDLRITLPSTKDLLQLSMIKDSELTFIFDKPLRLLPSGDSHRFGDSKSNKTDSLLTGDVLVAKKMGKKALVFMANLYPSDISLEQASRAMLAKLSRDAGGRVLGLESGAMASSATGENGARFDSSMEAGKDVVTHNRDVSTNEHNKQNPFSDMDMNPDMNTNSNLDGNSDTVIEVENIGSRGFEGSQGSENAGNNAESSNSSNSSNSDIAISETKKHPATGTAMGSRGTSRKPGNEIIFSAEVVKLNIPLKDLNNEVLVQKVSLSKGSKSTSPSNTEIRGSTGFGSGRKGLTSSFKSPGGELPGEKTHDSSGSSVDSSDGEVNGGSGASASNSGADSQNSSNNKAEEKSEHSESEKLENFFYFVYLKTPSRIVCFEFFPVNAQEEEIRQIIVDKFAKLENVVKLK